MFLVANSYSPNTSSATRNVIRHNAKVEDASRSSASRICTPTCGNIYGTNIRKYRRAPGIHRKANTNPAVSIIHPPLHHHRISRLKKPLRLPQQIVLQGYHSPPPLRMPQAPIHHLAVSTQTPDLILLTLQLQRGTLVHLKLSE